MAKGDSRSRDQNLHPRPSDVETACLKGQFPPDPKDVSIDDASQLGSCRQSVEMAVKSFHLRWSSSTKSNNTSTTT